MVIRAVLVTIKLIKLVTIKDSSGKKSGKKLKYCWAWNKGSSCKFGERCDFINKCMYCDSVEHGLHICPKSGVRHGEKPMGKKE